MDWLYAGLLKPEQFGHADPQKGEIESYWVGVSIFLNKLIYILFILFSLPNVDYGDQKPAFKHGQPWPPFTIPRCVFWEFGGVLIFNEPNENS